jgi:hypothetical protein
MTRAGLSGNSCPIEAFDENCPYSPQFQLVISCDCHGFGNHDDWIYAAMRQALEMMSGLALDVRLVSYGTPSRAILQLAKDFY